MSKYLIYIAFFLSGAAIAPLQAGDASAGLQVYGQRACVGCHGASGRKPIADYPVIGGKSADFIKAELIKFRSGERQSQVMNPMAAGLSDADIENVSTYLASQ